MAEGADVVDTEIPEIPPIAAGSVEANGAAPAIAPEEREFTASIHPGLSGTIPVDLGFAALELQEALGKTVWLLIQNLGSPHRLGDIGKAVRDGIFGERDELRCCDGAVLVVDSSGGQARSAFQIAKLFRRHCGGFTAVVPRRAKSAATLLVLGADALHLGDDAELGPLDVQIWDDETEDYKSALDEVQAIDRLGSAALDVFDQSMLLLLQRTGKRMNSLIPMVLEYSSAMTRPLLDKIDTVHYTQWSRELKVGEDYATRLLTPRYSKSDAERIARRLVNSYSEHGFVIDRDEIFSDELLGKAPPADEPVKHAIDRLESVLGTTSTVAVGRIIEKAKEGGPSASSS